MGVRQSLDPSNWSSFVTESDTVEWSLVERSEWRSWEDVVDVLSKPSSRARS